MRTTPDVTIRDYVKGQDLVYESPTSPEVELVIDKAKYYACRIDNIDKLQNDVNLMDQWSTDAAEKMKIAVETAVFGFYADANAANTGNTAGYISGGYNLGSSGTPISLHTGTTSTNDVNIIDMIMMAESALSEMNIPEDEDRFIVLPTWATFLLQTSDLRRADSTGAAAANDVLRNGRLGRLGNFNVYRSNNLPKSGANTIIPFGHKTGLTFASQLVENETLPHPTSFGKLLRGLQVFGSKVTNPECIGYAVANKK